MSYNKYSTDTKVLKKTIIAKYNDLVEEYENSQLENNLVTQLKYGPVAKTPAPVAAPVKKTTTVEVPTKTKVENITDVQKLFEDSTVGINDAFAGLTSRLLT